MQLRSPTCFCSVLLLLLLTWVAVLTSTDTRTLNSPVVFVNAASGADFISTVCLYLKNKLRNDSLIFLIIYALDTTLQYSYCLQREEILASRERRIKQIETLLEDSQQRYNDHKSGIRMLNDKELNDLQKKIDIYTRKLESMMTPLDEREVQRIIQREQIRNERLKERRNTHRELQDLKCGTKATRNEIHSSNIILK